MILWGLTPPSLLSPWYFLAPLFEEFEYWKMAGTESHFTTCLMWLSSCLGPLLLPGTTWLEMRISYGCWPCSVGTAQFLWSERKVLVRQGFNFCGSLLQSLAANLTSMALLGTVAWENGEERGRPSLWRGSFRFLSWSLRQNLRAPGAHF